MWKRKEQRENWTHLPLPPTPASQGPFLPRVSLGFSLWLALPPGTSTLSWPVAKLHQGLIKMKIINSISYIEISGSGARQSAFWTRFPGIPFTHWGLRAHRFGFLMATSTSTPNPSFYLLKLADFSSGEEEGNRRLRVYWNVCDGILWLPARFWPRGNPWPKDNYT